MKKKMSPRIPEPSGQYQITHLLLRHVLFFFTSGGLQLLWQRCVYEKATFQSSQTPAHDKGHFLLLLAEIRELVGLKASGKQFTEDNCDAWWLPGVVCLSQLLSQLSHFFLVANPEVMSRQQAQPLFSPEEREGPREVQHQGKKIRKRSQVSRSVRVFTYRNFFDEE